MRLPHEGRDSHDVFYKAALGEVPPVREAARGRDIPESLALLTERAMTKDTASRIQTALDFIEGLRDYLSGASQRRESTAITTDVRERAAKGVSEYRDHAEMLARLTQASTLWPTNPDLEPLRAILHEGYAQTALSRGDLVLARLQAESLPPGDRRHALASAIDAEEARLAREKRHLQMSRGAVAALVAIVIIGGAILNRRLAAERDATKVAEAFAHENARVASEARELAVSRLDEVNEANKVAVAARNNAEDLVAFMIGDMRERVKVAGSLDLLDGVASKAAEHYMTQAAKNNLSAGEAIPIFNGLSEVSDLQNTQGNLPAAKETALVALELARRAGRQASSHAPTWGLNEAIAHERLAGILNQMTGSSDEALEHYRIAQTQFGRSNGASSDDPVVRGSMLRAQVGRGQILIARGDFEAARQVFDELRGQTRDAPTLIAEDPKRAFAFAEAEMMLGDVFNTRGSLPDALESYKLAMETFRALRDAAPNDAENHVAYSEALARIGALHQRRGELADALSSYLEDREVCEALAASDIARTDWQQRVISTYARVGQVHLMRGDVNAAMAEYRAGLARIDARLERDPTNANWRREAGLLRSRVGDLHYGREEWTEALAEYTISRDLRVALAAADPSNITWQSEAAIAENKVASVLEKLGKLDDALKSYQSCRRLLKDLAALDPENAIVQRELSAALGSEAGCLRRMGNTDAAIAAQRESLAIAETLAARDPSNAQWQTDLAVAHNRLGGLLQANNQNEEALAEYLAFRGIIEQLAAQEPTNVSWRRELLIGWQRTARVLEFLGDRKGAKRDYAEAITVGKDLIERDPTNDRYKIEVAGLAVRLATLLGEDTDFIGAATEAAVAVEMYEQLAASAPENDDRREMLASTSLLCGRLLLSQYLPAEARPHLERAVEETRVEGVEGDKRTLVMIRRAIRTERLAQCYRQLGRITESKDLYAEAHALLEEHAAGMSDCELLCARGMVYAGLGRMAEANDMLRQAGQKECSGLALRELDEMTIPAP